MTCAYSAAASTATQAEEICMTGPKVYISNLAVSGWLIVASLLRVLQTIPCLSRGCVADEIG
jgi:hypothetical protein